MFAGAQEQMGIMLTTNGVIWAAGVVTVLGGAGAILWRLIGSPLIKLMSRTNEFLDDWFGVPDRDGVPGRKGVMVRLNEVEVGKADRQEIADLVQAITEKADRSEVLALREMLDAHIRSIDLMQEVQDA